MCIIIHSSGCIVCLLWPHFQRAQKQAGGVGSPEQRPFFPTRLGLRNAHHSAGTEPFTGLLAAHEWQLNHTELFPSTGAGKLHCKNIFAQLNTSSIRRLVASSDSDKLIPSSSFLMSNLDYVKVFYISVSGPIIASRWGQSFSQVETEICQLLLKHRQRWLTHFYRYSSLHIMVLLMTGYTWVNSWSRMQRRNENEEVFQ